MPSTGSKRQQGVSDNGHEAEEVVQYLTFLLSGEMYAFTILNVKEILEYANVTQVPMMPNFIQGVINLRGEVVPVINLARRFGQTVSTITKRTCVIIIEVQSEDQHQDFGVMVDSVSEVLDILPTNIRPAPGFGAPIRTDFIRGMGKLGEDFVIILAEDKVLSVDKLALVDEVRDMACDPENTEMNGDKLKGNID
ncbi:purine-binding chemotaxis protein CheW [Shewanella glacialimarina]|nr:purine-binding chemotaxis protein CheW [Shewanella glacialimarina]